MSDGCSGEFVVGQRLSEAMETVEEAQEKSEAPAIHPQRRLPARRRARRARSTCGSSATSRYLNQKGLDPTLHRLVRQHHRRSKQREDIQLNKFFLPFSGWFLTPKFRYYLYVWSSNPSQGDPAQVVGAGNLSYTFNRYVTLGGGITSLPSVRSTEGQFPYWLGVDDRLIADEFFRGSYTTGFWLKGELSTKFKYMAMLGNNLSTLGVSASQLDNTLDTTSLMLQWLPTTGEFGLYGTFGDFDHHEKLATRLGGPLHAQHARTSRASPARTASRTARSGSRTAASSSRPTCSARASPSRRSTYDMVSVDGGVKYKGLSLEAEYYWRWLSDFRGTNTAGIADIDDHGFQVQSSAMVVPKTLQVYLSGSAIRGRYGNASEVRAGFNWYVVKERGLRFNAEWLHLNKCPVGYTAVPYPVGGNGDVFHTNFELNF